jgi:Tfp pilus assembly protein PilP
MIGRATALSMTLAAAVVGQRDPFLPPEPPRSVALTPLERIEIGRVRLVALVYQPVERALLEDDAGVGYVAVTGTAIGARGGRVSGIERGRLRIREPASPEEIVLTLHEPAGSRP